MVDRFEVSINSSGDLLVWNPSSIRVLRETCRIFGRCVGTVARAPHQSALKGLPIKLSFEELVTLLTENSERFDLIINSSVLSDKVSKPTADTVSGYHSAIDRNYKEMSQIILEQRRKKTELHFANENKEIPNKKRKIEGEPSELRVESVIVHLPTATPVEWLRPGEHELTETPQSTCLADNVQFLSSLLKTRFGIETAMETVVRCAVFHRLWNKGHRVTVSCKKMGGDFLIYPDDPWLCHASHVVRLIEASVTWRPCELISAVRLTNSLKKIYLVASCGLDSVVAPRDPSESVKDSDIALMLQTLDISFHSFKWCGSLP